MGQTRTSASKHTVEIVTNTAFKKKHFNIVIICAKTEGVFSSSNCHLLIFKGIIKVGVGQKKTKCLKIKPKPFFFHSDAENSKEKELFQSFP